MNDMIPCHDLLILDRQALFCHGLVALVGSAHPDWHCAVAQDLADLRHRLASAEGAIVVIDLQHPELDGIAGIKALHATCPQAKIVVLSERDDKASILDGLNAGARGYIPRHATPVQIRIAIETVSAGGVFAPASLTGSPTRQPYPPVTSEIHVVPQLTDRQRDVFMLLAEGCATKTIARRLDLGVGTVKVHLAAIYRSLGAHNRLEAVAKAHRAASMM